MKYSRLIRSDIEKIVQEANFNDEQMAVFQELTKPSYGVRDTDTAIFMKLCISRAKYYTLKNEVNDKISRILPKS